MKRILIFLTIALVSLPVVYPFFQKGFFPTHDGEWAIVRLSEMHREIKDLQIPPRWAGYLNHGFGYPLFLFTYPLPYYLGEMVHILGLGVIDSVKAVFILSVLGSAITMFILAYDYWGLAGAFVSTTLYLYAPYRFTNLYVRGSLGESLAMVFFPLLFWLIWRFRNKPTVFTVVGTAFTLAAFILTHNAMVVLFLPFLLVWVFFHVLNTHHASKPIILALVCGILVAAYFWLPAILEKNSIALTVTPLTQRKTHFLSLAELFGYGMQSGIRPQLRVGIIHVFAAIWGGIALLIFRERKIPKNGALLLLPMIIVSFIALFSISDPTWQLPVIKEIDFPWRMLNVLVFLLSFLAGSIAQTMYGKFLAFLVVIGILILTLPSIKTQPRTYNPDSYYETNDATTTSADELMPVWVKEKPKNLPRENAFLVPASGRLTQTRRSSYTQEYELQVSVPTHFTANTLYFPGWTATLDGRKIALSPTYNTGLISAIISPGNHILKLTFARTRIRMVADTLSLLGLAGVVFLWSSLKKSYHT